MNPIEGDSTMEVPKKLEKWLTIRLKLLEYEKYNMVLRLP